MVSYTIMDSNDPVRFAIVFSVPWSSFHKNWYGLVVIGEHQMLDTDFYSKIKSHTAWHSLMSSAAFGYVSHMKLLTFSLSLNL